MHLRVVAAVSAAGDGVNNEDKWGATGTAAWILDGATEPDDGTRPTRPAQLVARVSSSLALRLEESGAVLTDVLADAIEDASVPPWSGFVPPSATVAIVSLDGDRLHALRLGDAAVIAVGGRLVDERHIEREQDLMRTTSDFTATLLERRGPRMNRAGGYWIVADDPEAAKHAATASWIVRPGDFVLLATDGLTRLVDLFRTATHDDLLARARTEGLDALVRDVRATETANRPHGLFLRAKCSDDATAVLLEVVDDRQ